MSRLDSNKKILKILGDFLEKNPDQRFKQALINLNLSNEDESYYEESTTTLNQMFDVEFIEVGEDDDEDFFDVEAFKKTLAILKTINPRPKKKIYLLVAIDKFGGQEDEVIVGIFSSKEKAMSGYDDYFASYFPEEKESYEPYIKEYSLDEDDHE